METVSPRQLPLEDIIHPTVYAKQSTNRWILKQYKLGNILYDRMLIIRYKLYSSGKTLASGVNKNKLVICLKSQSLSTCTQLNGKTISKQIPFEEIIHPAVYAYHN